MRLLFYCTDNFQLMDLSGPADVFTIANILSEQQLFELVYVSQFGGSVVSNSGVSIETHSFEELALDKNDTLFIVNGLDSNPDQSQKVDDFIRNAYEKVESVCSICTGLFVLAKALPNTYFNATTHWRYFDDLKDQHPNISLDHTAPFVNDGKIWSSAGISTAIDMSLSLLENAYGKKIAQQVAMAMVLPSRRRQNDLQISFHLLLQFECSSTKWENLLHWIQEHIADDLSIENIADHMAMSPRNFTRHCGKEFGLTPKKLVEKIRFDTALSLLQETTFTLSYIATRCGYKREENMKRAFMKFLDKTPNTVRKELVGV
ncbi:DJ-1/PfpI family protein [Vibrio sp. 99-70-13A1]|uniref:GlxA family transcriptional regulator n=1 Tax=Vibrio sp. 99-70-13A1 TaxID=2607601 RepID=UPI0014935843|nr:DJ-1/PfpI family protein [Vibrio sp. 99-70-13A1]NOH99373.1 helix-turn-helix domain-containing protein [Vibrio sp. 99-70-13A1]